MSMTAPLLVPMPSPRRFPITRRHLSTALCAASLLALVPMAQAQTKWDLPAAYAATNFHSENLVQFAADVDKASGGKLKIGRASCRERVCLAV